MFISTWTEILHLPKGNGDHGYQRRHFERRHSAYMNAAIIKRYWH